MDEPKLEDFGLDENRLRLAEEYQDSIVKLETEFSETRNYRKSNNPDLLDFIFIIVIGLIVLGEYYWKFDSFLYSIGLGLGAFILTITVWIYLTETIPSKKHERKKKTLKKNLQISYLGKELSDKEFEKLISSVDEFKDRSTTYYRERKEKETLRRNKLIELRIEGLLDELDHYHEKIFRKKADDGVRYILSLFSQILNQIDQLKNKHSTKLARSQREKKHLEYYKRRIQSTGNVSANENRKRISAKYPENYSFGFSNNEIEQIVNRFLERKSSKVEVSEKYGAKNEKRKNLGQLGEHFCLSYEKELLTRNELWVDGAIIHVSVEIGDFLGFDILSRTDLDRDKYIEVKTTAGSRKTPFILTKRQIEIMKSFPDQFYVYRLWDFKVADQRGILEMISASEIKESFNMRANSYSVTPKLN